MFWDYPGATDKVVFMAQGVRLCDLAFSLHLVQHVYLTGQSITPCNVQCPAMPMLVH